MPVGETLNESLVIDLLWGHGDQRLRTRGMTQARRVRHRLFPRRGDRAAAEQTRDRILLTWYTSTPRYDELLLPVLQEIGAERSLVLIGRSCAAPTLPPGVPAFDWEQAMGLRPDDWRRQYRSCRPEWARVTQGPVPPLSTCPPARSACSHWISWSRVSGSRASWAF